MRSRKLVVFLSIFLTLGLAVGALFLGAELNKETNIAPDNTKAASPLNCDLDKTSANPLSDNNQGNAIPEYCPGETGKFKVITTGRLYLYLSRTDLFIRVNNQTFGNINNIVSTNIIVNKDDYISVFATDVPNISAGIGWINPDGNLCGGLGWPSVSIQPLLDRALADNRTVIEKQCWGTLASGTGDFAFNSFQIVVAVEPLITSITPGLSMDVSPTVDIPTATPTPQILLSDEAVYSCGLTNLCSSDANCTSGNSCTAVNGTKRCVANICLTSGVANDVCESDMCTVKKIDIEKTVSISCVTGQNKKRLSYTIILTNPAGITTDRTGLIVVDTLDSKMKSDYIIKTSIPFGGSLNSGNITWNGLSLAANGGRLEIKYDAIVPPTEYGQEYVNNVIVSEGGIERGSQTISNKIEILPCTAIISDQADMLIFGTLLIFFGFIMYKIGVDKKVGILLWNRFGGRNVAYKLEGNHDGKLFKKDKEDFEKRIRRSKRQH